jgi:hypothetical protein
MAYSLLTNKSTLRSSYLVMIFVIIFLGIFQNANSLARIDVIVDNNKTSTTTLSAAQNINNNNTNNGTSKYY